MRGSHIMVVKKKLHPLLGFAAILVIVSAVSLSGFEQFGAIPTGDHRNQVIQSPHWHEHREIFVNRRPDILETMNVGERFLADPFGKDAPNFLFNPNQTKPTGQLPEIREIDLASFQKSDNNLKFIWLGHWTILMSLDDKMILIDPVFSDHASPVKIAAKRFQPPTISLEQLPPIDYILLSHDHYDHLDMETIKYFVGKDISFLTPLGVGAHLQRWGIEKDQITELDWWDEITTDGLTFAATPAQHFSGRIGVMHNNKTLWASWVLKSKAHTVYFSGDSGYDTHYREIGDAYGPFDLVFMDNGQYNEGWRAVHNLPDEAIKGHLDLNGNYYVPVGWGMFDLSIHNWFDPPQEATKLAKEYDVNLITPRLGMVVDLTKPVLFDQWWLEVDNNQAN